MVFILPRPASRPRYVPKHGMGMNTEPSTAPIREPRVIFSGSSRPFSSRALPSLLHLHPLVHHLKQQLQHLYLPIDNLKLVMKKKRRVKQISFHSYFQQRLSSGEVGGGGSKN